MKGKEKQRKYQQVVNLQHKQEIEQNRRDQIQSQEHEYQKKVQQLEYLRKQNQKISDDIKTIKPYVSQLSIYDDNFLEQQPKLLEYIEKAIEEGRA